jgi:ABC-type Mn2+/Zn2+ transport system permease subunit
MMTGLFASYYAGVAPGGLTALIAVFVLTLVMMMRKVQQNTALHKKTAFNK